MPRPSSWAYTDQGSQFTSEDFTDVLKKNGIQLSIDGKGRWVDHVFVERLWRSVRYENVYLRAYESMIFLEMLSNVVRPLLPALSSFILLDSRWEPLTIYELKERCLDKSEKPSWGTPFGNFFEVVLLAHNVQKHI